jgi:RNA polymerase sigma factor (sigma-70 family)
MATGEMREVIERLRKVALLQSGAGLTDGQLLENYLKHREEAAVAALVRRHAPMVWGVCRRVLGNHHDAEDAFQATFLVFVRKAASIASRELLANWLYGVAHQTALKARATAARRAVRERQVTEMPEPAAAEQHLQNDLQSVLDQELSRLPDKYRAAIVLCDLEGKTRKEAAQQLRLPEGTVGSRLGRARTMLAKRLARRGVAVSSAALAAALTQSETSAAVPASVVSTTIKAAALFAAGQAPASAVISAKAAALMEGVVKSMLLSKLKIGATMLLGFATVVAGAYALASNSLLAEPPQAKEPSQAKAQPKPAPAATEPQRPGEEQGRLEGRITAADTGKPVAGARIQVLAEGVPGKSSIVEAVSDTDGRYTLEIPFGHSFLWGLQSPRGYYTQDPKTRETIVATVTDRTIVRNFVLQRGRPWRVELNSVMKATGKPLMFSALPNPEQLAQKYAEILSVTGDAEGKAVLTIPTSGGRWGFDCNSMVYSSRAQFPHANLEIEKDFDPQQIQGAPEPVPERKAVRLRDAAGRTALVEGAEIVVQAGEAVVRLNAKAIPNADGLTLRGAAVGESGKPIAGAKFTVAFYTGPMGSMSHWTTTTRADGTFELRDFVMPDTYFTPDARIQMMAVKAGFDGAQTKELNLLEVKKAGSGDFGTVVLKPGRTLRGKVVDENGKPVHGALITNQTNYFLYGHLKCRTDAEGKFTMPDLSYGDQAISAQYGERNGNVVWKFDANSGECLVTVRLTPKSGIATSPGKKPEVLQFEKAPAGGGKGNLIPLVPKAEKSVPPPSRNGAWDLTPPLKEPKYQHEPKYALLVFGPKREQRIWMVLDGTTLYIDRNGNGDLTEPDKRIEPNDPKDNPKIVNPGLYKGFDIFEFAVQAGATGSSKFRLELWVRDEKFVPQTDFDTKIRAQWDQLHHENATLWRKDGSGQGQTPLIFMPKPADAQVCALDGPLTFVVKLPQYQVLQRGEAGGLVSFHIVVMGRPHRGAEQEFYNRLATKEVPEGAHLEVEIEYPAKAANAPPLRRKYLLKERC